MIDATATTPTQQGDKGVTMTTTTEGKERGQVVVMLRKCLQQQEACLQQQEANNIQQTENKEEILR